MAYTFNGVVYPDATNTGVPPGVILNPHNGDLIINTPGTVISGLKITGTVYINASNVTIKDCSITSNGYNVVNIKSGVTGAVVQNCDINGTGNGPQGQTGIGGQGTFANNNIYNVENGINVEGSNTVIKGNYIHDLNASGGSAGHYDGIQAQGGFNNVVISGNTVLGRDTSCIIIQNAFGAIDNIKVDGNLLLGQNNAAATIYVEEKAGYSGQITNAQVTNNVLGKGYYYWSSIVDTAPVWTNNVDYATGRLVTTNNTLSGTPTVPTTPPPATPAAPVIASFSNDTGKVGDGITSDTTLQLKGTAAANSTIKIYDGSTQIGTATANASGSWEYITAVLTNAQHVLKATATNASGQTSAASAALAVTVDSVAPTAPVLKSNTVVETNKVQLSGTAEVGSTVNVFDGANLVGMGTTGTNGSWSITTSALSSGSHTLTAKATDVAGNVSTVSQSVTSLIGGSPTQPSVPQIVSFSSDSGKAGDNVTNDNTLTLKGTAQANATVNLFDGNAQIGSVKADGSGNWSLTTAVLKDGTHTFTVSAGSTAALAAASAKSTALAVTIDTQAPTAPVLKTNSVVDTNHVLLSGSAEAGSTVKVYDGANLVGTGTAGANGSWTITTSGLSTGTHTLTATATDVAGNASVTSPSIKSQIGSSTSPAPAAPKIASFSNDSGKVGDNITNDNTLTLTGTAAANATVKVFDGAKNVGTIKADGSGNWSLTTAALTDGNHNLTATATDASGKTSAASGALAVKIDTHAPDAPTIGLYSKDGLAVGATTVLDDLIIKGTAEANSKVAIFEGGKQIGTATAGSNGRWSYDTGHLDDGVHGFTAKAMDVAGNASTSSVSKGVAVNADPVDITGLSYWSQNAIIKGTADAYSQIKLFDGNKFVDTVKADSNGNWIYKATCLSDQVHTFKAQAVDGSGHAVGTSSGSVIVGSSGSNTLIGTTGADIFVGNGHPDTFVFNANFGKDIIKDFDAYGRSHDTIQFSKSAFSDFASVLSHASQVGQDVVISNGDSSLTLKNTKLGSLQSHDFHFA